MSYVVRRVIAEKLPCERDKFSPERCAVSKDQLNRLHVHKLGKLGGYDVWLVDGTFVRDHIDIDFVAGGNPSRYGYVPMNELWVEATQAKEDIASSALHECVEAILMKKHGQDYDHAHNHASKVEIRYRKVHSDFSDEAPLAGLKHWLRTQA